MRGIILAAAWWVGLHVGTAEVAPPIPLVKGNQWVYEAEVRWTLVGGDRRSNHFRFTNAVVDCFHRGAATAAVVRSFPNDIGGMDPEVPRDYCVLLWSDNRLYRLGSDPQRQKAVKSARAWLETPASALGKQEPLLDCPLAAGRRWAVDEEAAKRDDGWYGWHVEGVTRLTSAIHGLPGAARPETFSVAYRTCPSHELMEVLPGVGITRYEFEHHGTIAEARVKLVEFIPAAPPSIPPASTSPTRPTAAGRGAP